VSWWKRLFSRAQVPTPTGPELPATVELIPGRLTARVVGHDVPTGQGLFPCWTYVSDGLRSVGQDELIFTLRRRSGEPVGAFPADPLTFFKQAHSLATQGRTVGPWGYTVFSSPRGFLGITRPLGFAYARPDRLPGTELPPASALAMTLLQPDEAAVVERAGVYRILSLLGRTNRYYPFPCWSDRDRPPVIDPPAFAASLLSKTAAGGYCPGASVRVWMPDAPRALANSPDREAPGVGDTVELWLPRGGTAELAAGLRSLGPSGSVALRTDPDPRAEVRLVWRPGQTGPETITPDGSDALMMTGGFLLLVFDPSLSDAATLIEDGFAAMLGAASWERVLDAITRQEPADVPSAEPGKKAFAVRWHG
jgi:hypothetical protein